jgi:iron complex outermembrane recepter protein
MEVPNMKITSTRALMLATTIISGMAFAAPAFAQTATAATSPSETEIVVVTGSRIRRPDLVASSPVTTIGAAELAKTNVVNLEGQLRASPQFITGRSQFDNNSGNGTPGTATVNLRGLGTVRTLVLMDGKRMTPFGSTGVVDINQVPLALIERVDIVTGGASAVYGSDAIAGVVNFITKQNFEGIQLDATGTQYTKGDGLTQQYQLTMGSSLADDKGNIVLSLGYANREAVLQGDREYSTYNVDPSAGDTPISDPSRRIGSSNAAATRFAYTGAPAASGFTGNRWFAPDGSIVTATGLPTGTGGARNSAFNYNPFNYFQTPQERYQATAIGRYEISDTLQAYAKAMFNSSTVPTQLAPSAYFGGSTSAFNLNLDNPFLTTAARTTLIGYYNALNPTKLYNPSAAAGSQTVPVAGIRRRLLERGTRNGVGDSTTFQLISGLSGEIDGGWSWDISGSYGESKLNSGTTGDISVARAQQALLAIASPTGPVCLDQSNGCAAAASTLQQACLQLASSVRPV